MDNTITLQINQRVNGALPDSSVRKQEQFNQQRVNSVNMLALVFLHATYVHKAISALLHQYNSIVRLVHTMSSRDKQIQVIVKVAKLDINVQDGIKVLVVQAITEM